MLKTTNKRSLRKLAEDPEYFAKRIKYDKKQRKFLQGLSESLISNAVNIAMDIFSD